MPDTPSASGSKPSSPPLWPPSNTRPSDLPLPERFARAVPSAPALATYTELQLPARTDERCLTYCTQRSNARTFRMEPVCHTLCWRKVYDYEQKLIDAAARVGTLDITLPGTVLSEEQTRELDARVIKQRDDLSTLAARYAPEKLARVEAAEARRKREAAALQPEWEAYCQRVERMQREGAEEDAVRRFMVEKRALRERVEQLSQPGPEHRYRSFGELLLPFPPPKTDRWSFLRGHYIYYVRGTHEPPHLWARMTILGPWGLRIAQAVQRDGREVGALLDSDMVPKVKGPKTVGLAQMGAEQQQGSGKKERDPNYVAVLSLEHVPPAIYDSASSSMQRIYAPVLSFLERYRESFASGQQRRSARLLWEKLTDLEDGPMGMWKKMGAGFESLRKEREREEREERRAREKEKGEGTP
ncbi:hypothetical protein CALVIDRAFT_598480 [Calocera viscosa TUFC12733]|uniref:Uncharacterized protein n=1 Tax=Calocera viscosa (strain TUFC12733) TaxID=1330018 RepID=A0A167LY26_CALVF|nr:hypothetical protein CALVIDRAFT_598480 [Calocera viscosa TUFC12733]